MVTTQLRHWLRTRSASPRRVRSERRRCLEVESLDVRIAPALTVTTSGTVLSIISDNQADVASVKILGSDFSKVVLGVFNNSTGSGAPIATPELLNPHGQVPILALASIQFIGNGGA